MRSRDRKVFYSLKERYPDKCREIYSQYAKTAKIKGYKVALFEALDQADVMDPLGVTEDILEEINPNLKVY